MSHIAHIAVMSTAGSALYYNSQNAWNMNTVGKIQVVLKKIMQNQSLDTRLRSYVHSRVGRTRVGKQWILVQVCFI